MPRPLAPALALTSCVLVLAACTHAPVPAASDAPVCAPGARQVSPGADALQAALDAAVPGDVLQLSATTYAGRFRAAVAGTAERPVVLCGVDGTVIDGGDVSDGYALHLDGAAYWEVRDLTVRGAQKGIVLDAASHTSLSGVRISDVGQEGLHLRAASSDNVVDDVTVERTGLTVPEFGEGVYVGSAASNWCRYTACEPDRSDRNTFTRLTVRDTTAEALDVKEGTTGGVVRASRLTVGSAAVVDSAVDLKGTGWTLSDTAVVGPRDAVSIHVILAPWGGGNTVTANALVPSGGGVGVAVVGPARRAGNVVACDNTVPEGMSLASIACG